LFSFSKEGQIYTSIVHFLLVAIHLTNTIFSDLVFNSPPRGRGARNSRMVIHGRQVYRGSRLQRVIPYVLCFGGLYCWLQEWRVYVPLAVLYRLTTYGYNQIGSNSSLLLLGNHYESVYNMYLTISMWNMFCLASKLVRHTRFHALPRTHHGQLGTCLSGRLAS
jgi:hypothetical protein